MSTTEPTTRAEPEMQAYGDYVLTIIDDQPIADGARLAADVRVVVTKNGEPFREFLYPAYRQWTLLAHWTDTLEAPQPEGEEPMTTAHDMSRFQRLIQVESGRVRGQFKVLRVRPDEAWVTPVDLTIYDEHHYSGIVYYSGDFAAHVKGDTVDVTRLRASKHADAMDAIEDLRAAIRAAAAAFPEGVQWMSTTEPTDEPTSLEALVGRLQALSIMLHDLYPNSHYPGDLDEAIHLLSEAGQSIAALAVEPEWEYARVYFDEAGDPHRRKVSVADAVEHAPDGYRADGTPYWNYELVRRRKAGPWEPVPETGDDQ